MVWYTVDRLEIISARFESPIDKRPATKGCGSQDFWCGRPTGQCVLPWWGGVTLFSVLPQSAHLKVLIVIPQSILKIKDYDALC